MRPLPAFQLLHITDSEGTDFLARAASQSSLVTYTPDRGLDFVSPEDPASHFVFGGDAPDRGHFSFTHLRQLVDFKKRYPDRVTLIVGNRDINKTRLHTELNPAFIRERLQFGESPRWLYDQCTHPRDYLTQPIDSLSLEQCQLTYLHWMLEKTMGSPHAFRYAREEMEREQGKGTVSDSDVLHRFIKESAPEGVMGQYLQHAQLGAHFPEAGILVLHGGVTPENRGRIPGARPDSPPIPHVSLWIDQLNEWYRAELQKWMNAKPDRHLQPAISALDDMALPLREHPRSTLISHLLDPAGQFAPPSPAVCAWLADNGIRLVITGHNPLGDYPLILRGTSDSLLFVSNDTSYSNPVVTDPDNTRGNAVHVTEISSFADKTEISIKGTLSDGNTVSTRLDVSSKGIEGDPNIGRVLPDHSVVQCRLSNGDYRLAKKTGRFGIGYSTLSSLALEPTQEPIKRSNLS